MRHKTKANIELLETRALLSGPSVGATLNGPVRIAPPILRRISNSFPVGFSETLKTNQAIYKAGQPIQMTFTVTNVSRTARQFDAGPSIDGFDVMQNGKTVWMSNAGINPMYISPVTLQPGQSWTLSATWNGIPSGSTARATGTFVVTNQLDPKRLATFQIVASPAQPASPTQPASPSPPDPQPASPYPPNPPSTSVSPPTFSPVTVTPTTDRPGHDHGRSSETTVKDLIAKARGLSFQASVRSFGHGHARHFRTGAGIQAI
jgi:hypothetical protein